MDNSQLGSTGSDASGMSLEALSEAFSAIEHPSASVASIGDAPGGESAGNVAHGEVADRVGGEARCAALLGQQGQDGKGQAEKKEALHGFV